jgi:hypothetical protein
VLSFVVRYRRPNSWVDRDENWHTHSLELCDEDKGVGDRECALMRAMCTSNVHGAPHIQHRRPHCWADRAQNGHKHSLGLCDEDKGVGDHECALMIHTHDGIKEDNSV